MAQLRISRDIESFSALAWDKNFYSGGFFSQHSWCTHAQRTMDKDDCYYLSVVDGDEVVSVLPVYALREDSPFKLCRFEFALESQRHDTASNDQENWQGVQLFCGGRNPCLTTVGHTVAYHEIEILRSIDKGLEGICKSRQVSGVGFLYVSESDKGLMYALEEFGYEKRVTHSTFYLDVPLTGLSAYIESQGKRKREQIRREIRNLQNAGVVYEALSLDKTDLRQISELEAKLYRKHGVSVSQEQLMAILKSIAANVESASILTAYCKGELYGFVVFFISGAEVFVRQVGIDYEKKQELPVYFGLMFYKMIELAHSKGATRIHYGIGSDATKLSRGCSEIRQYSFIKNVR